MWINFSPFFPLHFTVVRLTYSCDISWNISLNYFHNICKFSHSNQLLRPLRSCWFPKPNKPRDMICHWVPACFLFSGIWGPTVVFRPLLHPVCMHCCQVLESLCIICIPVSSFPTIAITGHLFLVLPIHCCLCHPQTAPQRQSFQTAARLLSGSPIMIPHCLWVQWAPQAQSSKTHLSSLKPPCVLIPVDCSWLSWHTVCFSISVPLIFLYLFSYYRK